MPHKHPSVLAFRAYTHTHSFFAFPVIETHHRDPGSGRVPAQLRQEVRLQRGTPGGEQLVNGRNVSAQKALAVDFRALGTGRWGHRRALLRRAVQHRRSTRSAEARIPSRNF